MYSNHCLINTNFVPQEHNIGKTVNLRLSMAFGWDTFNLRKNFIFYASYHNQPVNIAIHLLCIWPILATAALLLQYTPAFMATPAFIQDSTYFNNVKVNAAFAAVIIYCGKFHYKSKSK